MRTRTSYMGIFLAILLGLTACRKEVSTENGNGSVAQEGTFSAYIDGSYWEAADTAQQASLLGGLTNIIGVSSDGRQLSIIIPDTVTGTYSLDQNTIATAVYSDNGATGYSTQQGSDTTQAGGTVTITEVDKINKTITGSFAFKMYRGSDGSQKVFTRGLFNKLPYINSLPQASDDDTLYVTIDGSSWKAESILASAFSGMITVTGSNANASQTVGLVIPQAAAPGSYPLDYTQFTYFGTYSPSATTGLASASGTVQILENNTTSQRIRGNFSFKAVNPVNPADATYQLTNGYFSVHYN